MFVYIIQYPVPNIPHKISSICCEYKRKRKIWDKSMKECAYLVYVCPLVQTKWNYWRKIRKKHFLFSENFMQKPQNDRNCIKFNIKTMKIQHQLFSSSHFYLSLVNWFPKLPFRNKCECELWAVSVFMYDGGITLVCVAWLKRKKTKNMTHNTNYVKWKKWKHFRQTKKLIEMK